MHLTKLAPALVLGFVACSHAMPPASDPSRAEGLLPAGECGLHPYLDAVCNEEPRFAVVLGEGNAADATKLVAGRRDLAPGYPFAITLDDLPLADAKTPHAIVVVAGLFARAESATHYRALLGAGEVRAIMSAADAPRGQGCGDDECERAHAKAVQLASTAPAYLAADVERVERIVDEAGEPLARAIVHGDQLIAVAKPHCTVAAGSVHSSNAAELFRFGRRYAPVTCDDGERAWVAWRATRLESTVRRDGAIDQVVAVDCDVPTLEHRASLEKLGPPVDLASGRCD